MGISCANGTTDVLVQSHVQRHAEGLVGPERPKSQDVKPGSSMYLYDERYGGLCLIAWFIVLTCTYDDGRRGLPSGTVQGTVQP